MRVSNDTSANQTPSTSSSSTSAASKAKKIDRASATSSSSSAAAPSEEAGATISARAREMAKAKQIAAETPDIRDEKVAELRKRIAEGRYNVSPHEVASRMVDDHLKSEIG